MNWICPHATPLGHLCSSPAESLFLPRLSNFVKPGQTFRLTHWSHLPPWPHSGTAPSPSPPSPTPPPSPPLSPSSLPSPGTGPAPPFAPSSVRRAVEDGEGKDEEGAHGGQASADSFCRVMGLLGMGQRLFVPRLLATSKEDLLQADFEGALKFFRVQLPKRYRAAENARRLMEQACNIKVRPRVNAHCISSL
ncbi:TMF-regulated nuclear protein 1-like [Sphaeramia orbicularis]|uniref:TMF-regulated nuclear protein 1-like n=1 Tax=Sphaeramia orbicularis TaxID=375764 RepID=UPI00117F375D|nr:TMF-regulated nuclear protein 1-like [Sphaeramia orbicularis]